MDQARVGRFIAACRRERGLTQRQLAEQLLVSDKTISKWETGRGLPEVSLMLPLCAALGITVNDLLSGERVGEGDYRKKAEENMMELVRENAENRERLLQSIACGGVTVVAVCALVALAAFLPLPALARVALLLLAMATAVAGIWTAATLDARAGWFECPHCKELFAPAMADYVKGRHTFTRRRLTCPHCGQTGMCRHRVTR